MNKHLSATTPKVIDINLFILQNIYTDITVLIRLIRFLYIYIYMYFAGCVYTDSAPDIYACVCVLWHNAPPRAYYYESSSDHGEHS